MEALTHDSRHYESADTQPRLQVTDCLHMGWGTVGHGGWKWCHGGEDWNRTWKDGQDLSQWVSGRGLVWKTEGSSDCQWCGCYFCPGISLIMISKFQQFFLMWNIVEEFGDVVIGMNNSYLSITWGVKWISSLPAFYKLICEHLPMPDKGQRDTRKIPAIEWWWQELNRCLSPSL